MNNGVVLPWWPLRCGRWHNDLPPRPKRSISDSVERVSQGTDLVNKTGATIETLRSSITQVATLMQSLSQTSEHQASGISQVKQTVQRLDAATQDNMVLMSQSTQAAASMKAQATRLLMAVSAFEAPSTVSVRT